MNDRLTSSMLHACAVSQRYGHRYDGVMYAVFACLLNKRIDACEAVQLRQIDYLLRQSTDLEDIIRHLSVILMSNERVEMSDLELQRSVVRAFVIDSTSRVVSWEIAVLSRFARVWGLRVSLSPGGSYPDSWARGVAKLQNALADCGDDWQKCWAEAIF